MVQHQEQQEALLPLVKDHCQASKTSIWSKSWCINSKAARLILLWNFAMMLGYKLLFDIVAMMQIGEQQLAIVGLGVPLSVIAALSPLAGLVTDVKISRHKTVACSSCVFLADLIAAPILLATAAAIYTALYIHHAKPAALLSVVVVFGLILYVTLNITFITYSINAIQFGMDQLHDSPTKDSILFIHWYVWLYYAASLAVELALNLVFHVSHKANLAEATSLSGLSMSALILVISIVLIATSLCTYTKKKLWFFLEPAGDNPYRLVYGVTKFAAAHKVPLRRSAFTYTGDELPSRMDNAKRMYGGPFTTEQVEDVKAFWGILKVLFCIGPAFMLQTVAQAMLPAFAKHGVFFGVWNETHHGHTVYHQVRLVGLARHILVSNGLISPLLVVVCIPLYLCLLRRHVSYRNLGMLKRIGLGIVLIIVSLAVALGMDLAVHKNDTQYANCMFSGYTDNSLQIVNLTNQELPAPPLYQNMYFLTSEYLLSGIINMLIDIGTLELICSQSPYSMKGLLLGTYFSMKYFFQAVAITSIFPFGLSWRVEALSCGSGFYIMSIVIGILELLLFGCVAKKYQYRSRNEPTYEYHYAEEYYSRCYSLPEGLGGSLDSSTSALIPPNLVSADNTATIPDSSHQEEPGETSCQHSSTSVSDPSRLTTSPREATTLHPAPSTPATPFPIEPEVVTAPPFSDLQQLPSCPQRPAQPKPLRTDSSPT